MGSLVLSNLLFWEGCRKPTRKLYLHGAKVWLKPTGFEVATTFGTVQTQFPNLAGFWKSLPGFDGIWVGVEESV